MKSKSICANADLSDKELDRAISKIDTFGLTHSVWSIFDVVDKMNDVAVEGKDITLSYSIHWGEPVKITLPNNPTWKNLMEASDVLVGKSGDKHHVFVEDFRFNTKTNTLELITGS